MGGNPDRRFRTVASMQRVLAGCRACVDAGYPLESLPVSVPGSDQRAYLFGQAPGVVEGAERRPWRGRAGATLRRWLGMDEEQFYSTFYCASVTRCYPGRAASGRGDRTATPVERRLCRRWREAELSLLRPRLIVTVGGLAARELLGLERVTDFVGESYDVGGADAVPLPHPSGASGWLNAPANRARLDDALALVSSALARL